ncbi:MAG: protein O-mannosyl-transferase family [Anaerolineae bacterium]
MSRRFSIPTIVFLLSLMLYLRTLGPGVYVADFAEFQYLPAQLGLAHPNGFPLYMLLGWVWSHVPLGTLAWRMNLLSALSGALVVALTAGFVDRLTQRSLPALAIAGLTGLMPTLWSYSLVAERYTLNLALTIGVVWAAWEGGQSGKRRLAYVSAALFGLSLAVHPTNVVLGPFWLCYLIWRLPAARRSLRFWPGLLLAAGAPLLFYLYVPWRWAALRAWPPAPGVMTSEAVLRGLAHVWYEPTLSWRLIRNYITLNTTVVNLVRDGLSPGLNKVIDLAPFWLTDAPWWLLVLSAVGAGRLWRRDRAFVLALVGFATALTGVVAYIQQGKNDAYLLPATWTATLLASFGFDLAVAGNTALARCRPRLGRLAHTTLGLAVVALLVTLAWGRYSQLDKSRATETDRWWRATAAHPLEPDAALLAHWSDLTPMWYLQYAEGIRPHLLGLFPPAVETVIEPWLATGRPLYLAGPLHGWTPDLAHRYTLMPWGNLIRVLPAGQTTSCPPQARSVDTPATWPLVIDTWDIDNPLTGEAAQALRFCWQARRELPRATFLVLTLEPVAGGPAIHLDKPLVIGWYPAESLAAGTRGLAVLSLSLLPGAAAGAYRVNLMPYYLQENGQVANWPEVTPIGLGEIAIEATHKLRRADLPAATVPLVAPRAGPLVLRAWQLSAKPVRPGDPAKLELWWEVRGPLAVPPELTIGLHRWDGLTTSPITGPLLPAAPLGIWTPGVVLYTNHTIVAPRGRGDWNFLVTVRVNQGTRWPVPLPLGLLRVVDRPHLEVLPADMTPVEAVFGDFAVLAGYRLSGAAHAGEPFTVTLAWQVARETDQSYSVFVHLVDAEGRLVAQHDGRPAGGSLPTAIWVRGEYIIDPHTLPLPADLGAGIYALRVGLYLPETWERAPIAASLRHTDGALELATIAVNR